MVLVEKLAAYHYTVVGVVDKMKMVLIVDLVPNYQEDESMEVA
jgi:hypothetical protein